jgi:hypothetical protein
MFGLTEKPAATAGLRCLDPPDGLSAVHFIDRMHTQVHRDFERYSAAKALATNRYCACSAASEAAGDEDSHHPLPTRTALLSGWWFRTSDCAFHNSPERNAAVTLAPSSGSVAPTQSMKPQ